MADFCTIASELLGSTLAALSVGAGMMLKADLKKDMRTGIKMVSINTRKTVFFRNRKVFNPRWLVRKPE